MSETLRDLVIAARARLERAGIAPAEAAMDAALLARHALRWDLARFLAHDTEPPDAGFAAAYDGMVARRAGRAPMSAILGGREFWGLDFEVTPDVLAPRPETEIVIEAAVEIARQTGWKAVPSGGGAGTHSGGGTGGGSEPGTGAGATGWKPVLRDGGGATGWKPVLLGGDGRPLRIVDVGTGSGCLAVCLAREFPGAHVTATDVSAAALEVAARNASRLGVERRIAFVRTSLLDGVSGPVALIVSNPPYVPTGELAALPPEVRNWEPRTALDGGPDGLDMVRLLLAAAPRVLEPGGWLIMEFGFGQERGVREAAESSSLELVAFRADLQGIPRTLVARLPV